jgi:hypothetical protein
MKIDYEELILRIVKNLIIVIIITLVVYLVPDDIEKIKKGVFIGLIVVLIIVMFDTIAPSLPQNIKNYINRTN